MTQICTIIITVRDVHCQYHEEEWVKDIWPRMLPWFTNRNGVDAGRIVLGDGGVEVEWRYTEDYDIDGDETDAEAAAQAIEARRAETQSGSVADESAVAKGDAP